MMWAVVLVAFSVNVGGARTLYVIEATVLALHLAVFVGVLVVLLYFSPHGQTAEVFANFQDEAGWSSNGLSWLIGFAIAGNLPFLGVDAPAHLTEEVKRATVNVPRAMVWSVMVNGLLAFGTTIAFSYCILPSISEALSSPTGYDFIEVFYVAMGRSGTAGLSSLIIVFGGFVPVFGFLATASRQMWAFTRDGGLPFSSFFVHIDEKLRIPLRALVFCSVVPCLVGLINIGSTAAFKYVRETKTTRRMITH